MTIPIPGLGQTFTIHPPADVKVWGDIPSGPSKSKRLKAREQKKKMKKHRKRNNT
jgi:hypothetical protein